MVCWRRQQYIKGVVFLMMLWQLVGSQTSDIQLQTRLYPQPVYEQKPIHFELRLTWNGQPQDWQLAELPQFKLHNFMLEESGSATQTQIPQSGDTIAYRIFTFKLKPISSGEGVITAGLLRLKNSHGQTIELQVPETKVTILSASEHHPQYLAYVYWILLCALAIAVGYSFVLYLRRRQRKPLTHTAIAETFRIRLASEIDPKGGNLRRSFEQLERIYREYLQAVKENAMTSALNAENYSPIENGNPLYEYLEQIFQQVKARQHPLSEELFIDVYQKLYSFIEKSEVSASEEPLVK